MKQPTHNMTFKNLLILTLVLAILACTPEDNDDLDGDMDVESAFENELDGDLTEDENLPDGDKDINEIDSVDTDTVETDSVTDGDIAEIDTSDVDISDVDINDVDNSADGDFEDVEVDMSTDGDYENDESDTAVDGDEELMEDDTQEAEAEEAEEPLLSCNFSYETDFVYDSPESRTASNNFVPAENRSAKAPYTIAHMEPAPEGYYTKSRGNKNLDDLELPTYSDDLPLFERAVAWETNTRCFELPDGPELLTEAEAFDLYVRIVSETLWQQVNQTPGFKTVIGLRGAYPGTFEWHGNLPDRFNDTMALLWVDANGNKHLREFPLNTDTGWHNFGTNSSSSLRANRHYNHKNGTHRGYSALPMYTQLTNRLYPVRDDSNANGYWDSDRNGWLPLYTANDYDRHGNGHNIHMGSVNAPLGTAPVDYWSAGCQVIPGMENWLEFIDHAWTTEEALVDYFLIDARDIAPSVFEPCQQQTGSHACPFRIQSLPFVHHGNTALSNEDMHDYYNCSPENESGTEVVYVINIADVKMEEDPQGDYVYEATANIAVSVEVEDEELYDPDIHILSGDDQDACRASAHKSLVHELPPGRFLIVVDTWVNENNQELPGPYTLTVDYAD